MDRNQKISDLKRILLEDIENLCRCNRSQWRRPIVDTFEDLRKSNMRAVIFGGTLRSLLLSRIQKGKFGRPRDVDIVVTGVSINKLKERFQDSIVRETRFGGLQLKRMEWQFDVWPLEKTWAFQNSSENTPKFGLLPSTTFFNIEAIAIDVWPFLRNKRTIYSGDDQFFNGIIDRILEINREENPFPSLCIVRSLVFAASTGFSIGPRLSKYLDCYGKNISNEELKEVQLKHYGELRCDVETMRKWLEIISDHIKQNSSDPIKLPMISQLLLWPDGDKK